MLQNFNLHYPRYYNVNMHENCRANVCYNNNELLKDTQPFKHETPGSLTYWTRVKRQRIIECSQLSDITKQK